MAKKLKFPCGCIVSLEDILELNFPENCPAVWKLFEEGNTVGIFQLEKPLGQTWSKRVKPKNIEELAALISVLRPGPLESGMSDNYVRVKRGELEPTYLHKELEPILEPTNASLIYQEQSIRIARDLAGFSLSDADTLRRSLGKKNAELLSKIKQQFLDGIEKTDKVTKVIGETIFDWIEKGQRYLFVKSHAVEYAITAYHTAYFKSHFPLEFFCSYLNNSREKPKWQEDISILVKNALNMGIQILPPDIITGNVDFEIRDKNIVFGLGFVKNVGASAIGSIKELISQEENILKKPIKDFSWPEFLCRILFKINSQAAIALINSGALKFTGLSRTKMWYDYQKLDKLSGGEIEWLCSNCIGHKDLISLLKSGAKVKKEGGALNRATRLKDYNSIIQVLEYPTSPMKDSATYICNNEFITLGLALTSHSMLDFAVDDITHTCNEVQYTRPEIALLAVNIDRIKIHVIKNEKSKSYGQEMAFITISDETGTLEAVAFSDIWAENQCFLVENNKVYLACEKSKKDSYVIKKVQQISNPD